MLCASSGIVLSLKKKTEILSPVTTWMDLEDIMLGAISQSEKDAYRIIPLIGGIIMGTGKEKVVARDWEAGNGESLFNGESFSFAK